MNHDVVYHEEGMYAGWPANHGAWQWGDEFLVGFMRGRYEDGGIHPIAMPYEKVQARSLDGGETWTVETPNVDFESKITTGPPAFDITTAIIRCCGNYDTGGEFCAHGGGFYVSEDKGKSWNGAYGFAGLESVFCKHQWNTSRTRVFEGLVFLSAADDREWASDSTFVANHDGARFNLHGIVANDSFRAVMPDVTRIGDDLVLVARRKGLGQNWIDAYLSMDNGKTWARCGKVGDTGIFNGNPPAIAVSNGVLVCAFAIRSEGRMVVARSSDVGVTWDIETLRDGGDSDIGYPQIFTRSDGRLVCVYYWSDELAPYQHIAATVFV